MPRCRASQSTPTPRTTTAASTTVGTTLTATTTTDRDTGRERPSGPHSGAEAGVSEGGSLCTPLVRPALIAATQHAGARRERGQRPRRQYHRGSTSWVGRRSVRNSVFTGQTRSSRSPRRRTPLPGGVFFARFGNGRVSSGRSHRRELGEGQRRSRHRVAPCVAPATGDQRRLGAPIGGPAAGPRRDLVRPDGEPPAGSRAVSRRRTHETRRRRAPPQTESHGPCSDYPRDSASTVKSPRDLRLRLAVTARPAGPGHAGWKPPRERP